LLGEHGRGFFHHLLSENGRGEGINMRGVHMCAWDTHGREEQLTTHFERADRASEEVEGAGFCQQTRATHIQAPLAIINILGSEQGCMG